MCDTISMEGFYYKWPIFNIHSFSVQFVEKAKEVNLY